LLIMLAVQIMVSMAAMTLPVAAPVVALSFGFPVEVIGSFMAAMFTASIVATLSAGSLVTRHGAIRVSQGGLLLCALGLALCTLPLPGALPVGVVLIGLGYGPITPASSHLLARTTPAHRVAIVFSLKQTGVPLGGMLAGALLPTLLLAAGWRAALLAVAAGCLFWAAMAASLRARLDADRDSTQPLRLNSFAHPLKLVLAHPRLRKLALASFMFCAIQLSLTTYLVAHFNGPLGFTLVQAGLALAVTQAGGVAGRVLWGHVADAWLPPQRVLAGLGMLMALGSVALAALPSSAPLSAACVLLALFGACAIGWNGIYLAEVARDAAPGTASAATAGALVFTYLGMVAGPAMFALVLRLSDSYRLGFAALAAPAIAGGLLVVLSSSRKPWRRAS
jgi:MFS family permease